MMKEMPGQKFVCDQKLTLAFEKLKKNEITSKLQGQKM
jgi:hypothetical protein